MEKEPKIRFLSAFDHQTLSVGGGGILFFNFLCVQFFAFIKPGAKIVVSDRFILGQCYGISNWLCQLLEIFSMFVLMLNQILFIIIG